MPLGIVDIAAADDYAWVAPEDAPVITKVDNSGAILAVHDVPAFENVHAIALDPTDGGVWWVDAFSVGVVSAAGVQQQWDLAGANEIDAEDLIVGPDDHVWIARENQLVRVSRTGTIQTFNVLATGLASGPDGKVWYASEEGNSVGNVTSAGVITNYPQNVGGEFPVRITNGPGGKLWFTTSTGRVRDVTTSGVVTAAINGGAVWDITTGDDGFLWWYDATPALKKYNTSTNTVESTYPVNALAAPLGPLSASAAGVWWGSELAYLGKVTYAGATQEGLFRPVAMLPVSITSSATELWFTAPEENQVGRMTTAGVAIAYDLPVEDSVPSDIVIGPDGAAWFVEMDGDRIGRIDAAGVLQEFTVPTAGGEPDSIAVGSDGNLWFTLPELNRIVRLTPAGVFTQFTVPNAEAAPTSLVLGSDGNLWFIEFELARIGRITPAGVITDYPSGGIQPQGLVAGPDGKLWYSTFLKTHTMTTSGVVTTFNYSSPGTERIVGPDGALWAIDGSTLMRLTLDGLQSAYALPDFAGGLTIGPDGKLWFTGANTRSLYRIDLDAPMTAIAKQLCMPSSGAISGVVASFVDPDETKAASYYNATISWGDGTNPTAGQVVQTSAGHFDVVGTKTYSTAGVSRNLVITFNAPAGPDRLGGSVVANSTIHAVSTTPAVFTSILGSGETQTLTVNSGNGCAWTATSNRTWITFPEGNTGAGNATLYFTVAENPSSNPREGIITINGYEVLVKQQPNPNPPGTNFYLITPCRIYDSRSTGGTLAAGVTRQITASGVCGISADALAITSNITVVSPSSAGWLSAYKAGFVWPGVSTVSYRANKTRANNTVIAMNGGAFNLMNGGSVPVHFIVDVTGYFQ
ncbi:MAG TPA: BACON domain-containing carbohydrate-binding protein [Thermoanaerobaculia bacterium]